MTLSVKFNGHELADFITVTSLDRGIGTSADINLLKIGNSDGEKYNGTVLGKKTIPMGYVMLYDLVEKRRELARILHVSEPAPLIFGDEPDKVYYAIPTGDIKVDEINILGKSTIEWIVPDGVAYSVESKSFTNYEEVNEGLKNINLVHDSNFENKIKFWSDNTYISDEQYQESNVLSMNYPIDPDRPNDRWWYFNKLDNGISRRYIKSLKAGDSISVGIKFKIDRPNDELESNLNTTMQFGIEEFDSRTGNRTSAADIPVTNVVLGEWQELKLENYKIKSQNTKYISFNPVLLKNGYVSIAEPQMNLGDTLLPYNTAPDDYRNFIDIENNGSYKAYPVIEAVSNGDNGLFAFIKDDAILQFGKPDEVDGIESEANERVITEPYETYPTGRWETNTGKIRYEDYVGKEDTKNYIGGGWKIVNEALRPVFQNVDNDRWGGPTYHRVIPLSEGKSNTLNCHFRNRFVFDTDIRSIGRIEYNIQSGDDVALSMTVKDSLSSSDAISIEGYCNGEWLFDEQLDKKLFSKKTSGNGFELQISRFGDSVTFYVGAIDEVTQTNVIKTGSVTKSFTLPSVKNQPLTSVTIWVASFGNQFKSSSIALTDTRFFWIGVDSWQDIPNTFQDGDIFQVDTSSGSVLVDGVQATTLGALGNMYDQFALEPGKHRIEIIPSKWAQTPQVKVYLTEAWL